MAVRHQFGPIWFIFFLVLSHFNVHSSIEPLSGNKRQLNGEENKKKVVRRILFYSPCALSQVSDRPPKLFDLVNSSLLRFYPQTYQDFARIFTESWNLTQNDYVKLKKLSKPAQSDESEESDLELFKWSECEALESLSLEIHISYIKELFDRAIFYNFTEDSLELIDEYVGYVMRRSDSKLDNETVVDLLSSALKLLRPSTISIILGNSTVSPYSVHTLWVRLFAFAATKKISLENFIGQTLKWFEIFRIFCLEFGPMSLENLGCIERSLFAQQVEGHLKGNLPYLPRFQPILAAVARHDSEAFLIHFAEVKQFEKLALKHFLNLFYCWIDAMFEIDEKIKYFTTENKEKLATFADSFYATLMIQFISSYQLITYLFSIDCNYSVHFLLTYSATARASIPDKTAQCQLLVPLIYQLEFDSNFTKLILIIAGFNLNLEDIETRVFPKLDRLINNLTIDILRFILQIADAFKDNSIKIVHPALPIDFRGPVTFEAGRILLAKHFRISPFLAKLKKNDFREDVCFDELAWFMTFFINKYRPDLGPEFSIKLSQVE